MYLDAQLFSTDVNSPLKQQNNQNQQNQQTKDGNQGAALNGRKPSMSQNLTSPSGAPRPAARRRETTDTNPFSGGGGLISPTSAGPGRMDMQSWFGRKGMENKEGEVLEEEKPTTVPESATRPTGFNGLTRSSTTGASGFSTASLWAATGSPTPTTSAFGGFGNFNLNTPSVAPDKGFASSSGGSRFFSKKESAENIGVGTPTTINPGQSWRSRPRTDTDPFGVDEGLSGSAALGGARDTSPPPMPTAHGAQIFDTPAKGNASDFGMSGLSLGGPRDQNASSASPSQTNPYRSPPTERGDNNEHDDLGFDRGHPAGLQSDQNSNFGSIRGFPAAAALDGSDRSQTSSVGAKNYPPLSNITGWPATFATATPDRDRAGFGSAFGNSVFSPMTNEVQSPGLGNMGGLFGSASASGVGLGGSGSVRGSKLTSLFPTGMQLQMQNQEHESLSDSIPDLRQNNPLGAIGAGTIGLQSRDTESPMPMGRGFMDMFSQPPQPAASTPGVLTSGDHNPALLATASQGHAFGITQQGTPFSPEHGTAGPPQSQTRTMVMPDRMRWVYMDPQGTQQGPFTGLEMNEWYKANFFTNDLRVRKLEDVDFEPLGQLIRRIGNSREPFLVPQVGIPHGQPAPSGPFPQGGDSRGVLPPLMGIVPSYGKTLTAEEQNNLERRKQEEQLAMARQREFAAQHNHYARNMHPGVPGGVQHQASMHSLQSQPSFGSITSPIGMTPHVPIGAAAMGVPTPGFFDQAAAAVNKGPSLPAALSSGPEHLRGDVHEHERQMLANYHGPGGVSGMFPPQPVGAPAADLKSQLPNVDQLERDPQGFKDRLKEFQEYQGIPTEPHNNEEAQPGLSPIGQVPGQPDAAGPSNRNDAAQIQQDEESVQKQHHHDPQSLATKTDGQQQQPHSPQQQEVMSLTQQVQRAQQDAVHAAHKKAQEEEAWARQSAAIGLPMPFPPPPPSSSTPLPAPTAQRRTNIADQYIDTRSQSQTPDSAAANSATAAQPPPMAPWARDPGSETQKGPSLKEIQEAEAQKAAQMEAQRRAVQEQEALASKEREKVNPAVVPGLPANSTWGSGSPAPSASSPWSKPGAPKVGPVSGTSVASGSTTPSKKTLAEIQREEEARKLKASKEYAIQAGAVGAAASFGKRYADLASKTGPPGIANAAVLAGPATAAASGAGGWATVGAGGKVKAPPTAPAAQGRSVSATTARTPVPQSVKPQVKSVVSPTNKASSVAEAQAAFRTWVRSELSKGLAATHSVDNVATLLLEFDDPELIRMALYEAKSVVDPPYFSQEFLRRKKQADRGIWEPVPISEAKAASSGGGWSEVAKKSSSQPKESDVVGAGFKVVPRKKGKK